MELKQRKRLVNIPTYDTGKGFNNWVDIDQSGSMRSNTQSKSRYGMYSGYGIATPLQVDLLDATTRNINNRNVSLPEGNSFGNVLLQQPVSSNSTGGTIRLSPEMKPNIPDLINIDVDTTNNTTEQKASSNGLGDMAKYAAIGNIALTANSDIVAWYNHVYGLPTSGLILANAGSSNNSIMGYGYRHINDFNGSTYTRQEAANAFTGTLGAMGHGAAAGASVGGPIGGIVGAAVGLAGGITAHIFGRNKLERQIERAKAFRERLNAFNRSSAMGKALTNDYYSRYGNTADDILYANRGKDLKQPTYVNK